MARRSASAPLTLALAAVALAAAWMASIRATIWPAFTASPSFTRSSTSRPITLDPMSAYRWATICPDAVTNDRKTAWRAAGCMSTATPPRSRRITKTVPTMTMPAVASSPTVRRFIRFTLPRAFAVPCSDAGTPSLIQTRGRVFQALPLVC